MYSDVTEQWPRIQLRLWLIPSIVGAALVLIPIGFLLLSWLDPQTDVWRHLLDTKLLRLLSNTAKLMLGVGILVFVLGVSLAWLVAVCEFPGRRFFEWMLVLPLAMPAYVLAFVAIGLFDFSGPVQTAWRGWFGEHAWFPSIRSTAGVITVLALVFYPYVYLLARGAFLRHGRATLDAARLLGHSPLKSFFSVVLPMARPAIAAGMALAIMETLADFGTVATFNFDTFTTAIYQSWFGLFNLTAATQLASVLLLFVLLLLIAEQKARKGEVHQEFVRKVERYQLRGGAAICSSGYCMLVLLLAFALPFAQLCIWVFEQGIEQLSLRFLSLVLHTLALGLCAAGAVVVLALLVAYGRRLNRSWGSLFLERVALLGYALPGSILAVGIVSGFTRVADIVGLEVVISGTLVGLMLAYTIRFFAVGYGPISTHLERLKPSLGESSKLLGETSWGTLRRVFMPMLMPGALTAGLMVLVDVMKEMPATLLLRPFGYDTLAVKVFELTSEGEWERAALPSIILVAVGLIPVVFLTRRG